jgi:hypothetical protein
MKRTKLALSAILLAILSASYLSVQPPAVAGALPEQLTDKGFWALSAELSEPDGYFRSDNLVSNEIWMQHVIPDLVKRSTPGRVYLGVGPEQNFTYIAALKPAMVFIVDIRRGNLHLHLMYKALFELSADRADFVGRLFARKRPDGLTAQSTASQIFSAYSEVPASEAIYAENLQAIKDHLVKTRGLPISEGDLAGIEYVAHAFYSHGLTITYSSSGRGPWRSMPNYMDLMLSTDEEGNNRSYLANEANFLVLKNLHAKNLLVPVVGDFGGGKALRAVGKYVRDAGSTVGAFYLSNVEQYLGQRNLWDSFCANVATMPLDGQSTFIRSVQAGRGGYFSGGNTFGRGFSPRLINRLDGMQEDTANCR